MQTKKNIATGYDLTAISLKIFRSILFRNGTPYAFLNTADIKHLLADCQALWNASLVLINKRVQLHFTFFPRGDPIR